MKISSLPVVKTFDLKSDPDGQAKVSIRQATFEESRLRSELFAKTRYTFDNAEQGQFTQEQDINTRDMEALEIYLTISGAENIWYEALNDAGAPKAEPMFEFTATTPTRPLMKGKFLQRLGLLPEEVVREIHGFVRVVNPQWGPQTKSEGE